MLDQSLIGQLIGQFGVEVDLSKKVNNVTFNITTTNVNVSERLPASEVGRLPSAQSASEYHAVFLTNGQVYFGRLKVDESKKFMKLEKVFYIQSNDQTESGEGVDINLHLMKLGSEIHAPKDEMNINIDQIIFWEPISDAGPIAKAIIKYEQESE